MSQEEITRIELEDTSEYGLRGELALWGYNPSPVIKKDVLVNMLMYVYFGSN